MDIGWLFTIPAALGGFSAGWIAKPERESPLPDAPKKAWGDWFNQVGELHARMSDLESRTHHHAVPELPGEQPPHHGPDYVAWGHDGKQHWRRHRNGTVETSEDGNF